MNHARFDELVKQAFRFAGTRRSALRLTVGGVASAIAGVGLGEAASAKKKKRKRCNRSNDSCNINRPGACCSSQCCFDSTSSTNGTCSSKQGTCCTARAFGGYCPQEFPICCGSDRCCAAGQQCCLITGGRGVCCDTDLGQTCVQGQGCVQEPEAPEITATSATGRAGGVPRGRAGR